MTAVFVTGAAGHIGRRLIARLAGLGHSVVATDLRAPDTAAPGVTFETADIRDRARLTDLLTRHRPDTVVHLAGVVGTGGDPARDREIDVGGIDNLLAAMADAGTAHLIVTSSGAAYGYHADNPVPLTEDAPLRGNDDFPYAKNKRLIEERLDRARGERPELSILVFRPGTVLGPGFDNQITRLFQGRFLPAVAGHPSPFVFVWVDDLVDLLVQAITERRQGVYNVAGDGWLTPDEIAVMTGQRVLSLPAAAFKTALWVAHALGKSAAGPAQVKFLQFRPVLSNAKLKRDFRGPELSSRQALAQFLYHRADPLAVATAPAGRWLIVGAGPAGLAVARNFKDAGIDYDQIDAQADVGGLWLYGGAMSTVYASTHLISSTRTTEFPDFPMADDLPPFPSHSQVAAYMRGYARHFGLTGKVRLTTRLDQLTRDGQGWAARFADGSTATYDGVVIANGHLNDPALPQLPGDFAGRILHSRDYKTADIFRGKRVLIVGSGNTGCDVVVDAVHQADKVFWSVRSGNYFVPKFVAGKPADRANARDNRLLLPMPLRNWLHEAALRLLVGPPDPFGLPKPQHRLYERTPIVNSQVLLHLGQGDVTLCAEPERYDGTDVVFTDGRRETIDLVLLCTGYKVTFPFIDPAHLNFRGKFPILGFNVFPPKDDNLYVAGLIEAAGAGWGARDLQARLIANAITARSDRPEKYRALRAAVDADIARDRPQDHPLFVEFAGYKRLLKQLAAMVR